MDIILGLIWVGTPHIQIGLDTAYYSESGKDTAHNITCYSESGGDTAQENVFRYSHWGGDTAHNTTYYLESWGGHRTRKCVQMFTLGWGHRTEFKDRGRVIIVPILAPSCKVKLARFSGKLRIQDEGKVRLPSETHRHTDTHT